MIILKVKFYFSGMGFAYVVVAARTGYISKRCANKNGSPWMELPGVLELKLNWIL